MHRVRDCLHICTNGPFGFKTAMTAAQGVDSGRAKLHRPRISSARRAPPALSPNEKFNQSEGNPWVFYHTEEHCFSSGNRMRLNRDVAGFSSNRVRHFILIFHGSWNFRNEIPNFRIHRG